MGAREGLNCREELGSPCKSMKSCNKDVFLWQVSIFKGLRSKAQETWLEATEESKVTHFSSLQHNKVFSIKFNLLYSVSGSSK